MLNRYNPSQTSDEFVSIRVLAANVQPLEEDAFFRARLERVSEYRREKVLRFHFRRDRNLSLGAGLLLDAVLREYGLRERDMAYGENGYGKPYLCGYPGIHFSVSHAGDYVDCAVGSTELGIDVEQIALHDWDTIRSCLSDAEQSYLLRLPAPERWEEFTRLWTLKESFLKAAGTGIAELFPAFDPVSGSLSGDRGNDFRFREFRWPGYRGALCLSLSEPSDRNSVPVFLPGGSGIPSVCEQIRIINIEL